MLEKEEYRVTHHNGKKLIVCDRLDMFEGMEEKLLQGATFAYKCAAVKDNALMWKEMYEQFSKRQFTTFTSRLRNGRRTVFKGKLRCMHKIPARSDRPYRKRGASKRDTGCPATLTTLVRTCEMKRSKLPTAGGYNLRVYSNGEPHNHAAESVLQFRRVGDSTKMRLLELFDQHHSPASALEVLKLELLKEHGDAYLSVAADRYVLPDKGYVNRLFYKTYRERYGDLPRKEVRKLQEEALRQSAVCQEQGEIMAAANTLIVERFFSLEGGEDDDEGDGCIDSFIESEELPRGWFSPEVTYGETACTDASREETAADNTDGASAATPGNVIMYVTGNAAAAAAGTARPDGASVEVRSAADPQLAQQIRQWAAEVTRQISADGSGQWRDAAADFLRNWERLPAPGRLAGLRQFGRPSRHAARFGGTPASSTRQTSAAVSGRTDEKLHETVSVRQSVTPYCLSLCVLRTDGDSHGEVLDEE